MDDLRAHTKRFQYGVDMFGAWCGMGYVVLLLLGFWVVARYVPAHPPGWSAEQIAEIVRRDYMQIRIGMVLCMIASTSYLFFAATIAKLISRVEGGVGVLTMATVMAGVGNMMVTFYPATWFLIMAYRPERSAELIYLLSDTGWLQFVGGLAPFMAILFTISAAALYDRNPVPSFPRWVGYFNIWAFVLFLPGLAIFFFHSGPFAWNGILAFWVGLTVFSFWFFVMFYSVRKTIQRLNT